MQDLQKRGITAIFILIVFLLSSLSLPEQLLAFSDLPAGHWAGEEISSLTAAGVLSGYPDGTFQPEGRITRAEFAKIVALAFRLPLGSPSLSRFPDVPAGWWAASFIEACAAEGLVQGFPDGNFRPGDPVSKEQVLAVLVRKIWHEDIYEPDPTFSDVAKNRWSFALIETALVIPLFELDDSHFALNRHLFPEAPATRAQVCVWVWRSLNFAGGYQLRTPYHYSLDYVIRIKHEGGGEVTDISLTLPLLKTEEPFQSVELFLDHPIEKDWYDEDGNQFVLLRIGALAGGETRTLTVHYEITATSFSFSPTLYSFSAYDTLANEYLKYTRAEDWEESDAWEIQDKAWELTGEMDDPWQAALALYHFTGEQLVYSGYLPQSKGAHAAFISGEGDCTEFADLFVALCRARGIPARFLEGFIYSPGATSRGEQTHDWAEILLPNGAWLQVDPTYGRYGENYFGASEGSHFLLTRGRNIEALGGYHFFYYHYWWEGGKPQLSSLDEVYLTAQE